uniref:Uncharacterized protein n=1 Tax=Romanomermis culicivorax TaxID=13658 RepID=A0A915IAK7_ROMCU
MLCSLDIFYSHRKSKFVGCMLDNFERKRLKQAKAKCAPLIWSSKTLKSEPERAKAMWAMVDNRMKSCLGSLAVIANGMEKRQAMCTAIIRSCKKGVRLCVLYFLKHLASNVL